MARLTAAALIEALTKEVALAGGRVTRVERDRVTIEFDVGTAEVFLDNLRRRVAAGENLADVTRAFARALVPEGEGRSPPEDPAALRAGLRTVLERRDVTEGIAVARSISDELVLVLAWIDPDEERVLFVSEEMLRAADLPTAVAWQLAGQNMDALVRATPLEIDDPELPLGMLATASVLKASLLTAPGLKQLVEPRLGWPVRAVAPCRDFVFLFRATDEDLLPRLAQTVLRELSHSAYPLSAEVLEIGDQGPRAIGTFRTGARTASSLLERLVDRFDADSLSDLLEQTRLLPIEETLPFLRSIVDALAPRSSSAVVSYLMGWIAHQRCLFRTAAECFRVAAVAFPYSLEAGLALAKCLVSEPLVDYAVPLDEAGEPTRAPRRRKRTAAEQRAADDVLVALSARLDRALPKDPAEELLAILHGQWLGGSVDAGDVISFALGQSMDRGDANATLDYCERLIKVRPTFFKGWGQRALELTKLQRHDEAIGAYADAIAIYTSHGADAAEQWRGPDPRGQLHFNRACELAWVGRKADSLVDLKAAIGYEKKWAAEARTDDYFKALWKDRDFLAVVKRDHD